MPTRTSSHPFSGTWYSTFVSPSKNIHYFEFSLPALKENQVNACEMTLVAARQDTAKLLTVTYRVHAEIQADPKGKGKPCIAILAKDSKVPSDGVNVMVLELLGKDAMLGTFIWNSLTKGEIKSKEIFWTRAASPEHTAAYRTAGVTSRQ